MTQTSRDVGEAQGRGYSALDLEKEQRRRVLAEADQKLPGVQDAVRAALLAEKTAQAEIKRLRKQIQEQMPGDAVVHIFTAASLSLDNPQR